MQVKLAQGSSGPCCKLAQESPRPGPLFKVPKGPPPIHFTCFSSSEQIWLPYVKLRESRCCFSICEIKFLESNQNCDGTSEAAEPEWRARGQWGCHSCPLTLQGPKVVQHVKSWWVFEAEQCFYMSPADTDGQHGAEDAWYKEKSLNKMIDLFTIPPHQLFPSLAVPKHPLPPKAALRAVTSLTPVSHTLTDRRKSTHSSTCYSRTVLHSYCWSWDCHSFSSFCIILKGQYHAKSTFLSF